MERDYLEHLKSIDENLDLYRGVRDIDDDYENINIKSYYVAYVLYQAQLHKIKNIVDFNSVKSVIHPQLKTLVQVYCEKLWSFIHDSLGMYSTDELASYILFHENEKNIYINTLIESLLDIKIKDSILAMGTKAFSNLLFPLENTVTTIDDDNEYKDLLTLQAILLDKDFSTYLDSRTDFEFENTFDKILYFNENIRCRTRLPIRVHDKPDMWTIAKKLMNTITDSGKIAIIMDEFNLVDEVEKEGRKYFIDHGFIEKVVLLPSNRHSRACIDVVVILSKANKKINFVDVRTCWDELKYDVERDFPTRNQIRSRSFMKKRQEEFDRKYREKTSEIIKLIGTETLHSTVVDYKECVKKDYSLHSAAYMSDEIFENACTIDQLLKNIKRGTNITQAELRPFMVDKETEFRYLRTLNVHDGFISFRHRVLFLKEIPKKHEKYCAAENMILLSKMTATDIKCGIVPHDLGDIKLLPSDNFIILDIDSKKVDPYYVLAFLISEKGQTALQKLATGTGAKSISAANLKKMQIPRYSKEVEQEMVEKYKTTFCQVATLREQLRIAERELVNPFNKTEE